MSRIEQDGAIHEPVPPSSGAETGGLMRNVRPYRFGPLLLRSRYGTDRPVHRSQRQTLGKFTYRECHRLESCIS